MNKCRLALYVAIAIVSRARLCHSLALDNIFSRQKQPSVPPLRYNERNDNKNNNHAPPDNDDEDYPWKFTGRLWFRPSLVRVPSSSTTSISTTTTTTTTPLRPPSSVTILSLFGWTIGGVVALEYDTSPVGPYREYVTMGAVVSKRGALGQWGSKLYVSNAKAERICRDIWGVPAETAVIDFFEDGEEEEDGRSMLTVAVAPSNGSSSMTTKKKNMTTRISVGGWQNTRVINEGDSQKVYGGLPVLWTPTIKALWAPFVPLPSLGRHNGDEGLPLHNLRLSAGALRLAFCGQEGSDALGLPFGIGLVVDNVLIEISPQSGDL